ncbi:MAG: WecB/TagA/CpsF family glycosyltransferase [Rhodobacteraceae bacterium]|nr:WecB/TagA/CpsF family glycosyltransferase [Paracoccaceae bacterium]
MNPHSYAVAKTDAEFNAALQNADWLVPDGIGIVLAGRLLNRPMTQRITGFDIFDGVMKDLDRRGGSVFFLGSTEETLAKIRQKLPQDFPNVSLAGTLSPPFKPSYDASEIEMMVEAIALAKADVLWVGMTAPKQEKWICDLRDRLDVSFVGAIGAVFDFYVGNVKRSHPIFQKTGFEWLPRLLQQPKRLWRRMFVSAPIFMWDVLSARRRGSN